MKRVILSVRDWYWNHINIANVAASFGLISKEKEGDLVEKIYKAAEKFENTVDQMERMFKEKTLKIDSLETFCQYSSVWYELGYQAGKHESLDVEIGKRKKEEVTVLLYQGKRYILDHQNQFKGKNRKAVGKG